MTELEDIKKPMALHTILLQNNALHEVPSVLKRIPSLKVVQLHGNPCVKKEVNLPKTLPKPIEFFPQKTTHFQDHFKSEIKCIKSFFF